jgi:MYXO-CTERM domain-containing protein
MLDFDAAPRRRVWALAVGIGSLAAVGLSPRAADAHFMLVSPTSWWTQASDGSPQKTAPCGNEAAAGQSASKVVTNVQPGQTVTVQVTATVAHPGWWRISLKQGASSTQTTTSLPDPAELGAAGSAQQCTPAFIDSPVWSTTQPVLADKLGIPASSPNSTTTVQSGTQTFNVTIPSNATCTSAAPCTLQVVMFMTDHTYPTCNYHHCADIAFATSTGTGGSGGSGAGGAAAGGAGGAGGRNGGGGRGGTTGTAGAAGSSAGSAGTTGTAGRGGGAGTTGSAGTTGTAGTAGTAGATGTGEAGTTGAAGSGASGAAGTTGSAGSGTTGAAGTSTMGTAGSGATGTAGTTGELNSSTGCSCATGGGSTAGLGGTLLLLAVVIARRRRRR